VSLSGGEAQPNPLATADCSDSWACCTSDEPSIRPASADNARLFDHAQDHARPRNTLIVVEHDKKLRSADYVGIWPARAITAAKWSPLERRRKSHRTKIAHRRVFKRAASVPIPASGARHGKFLTVRGARAKQLEKQDGTIPLGMFVCGRRFRQRQVEPRQRDHQKVAPARLNPRAYASRDHDALEGVSASTRFSISTRAARRTPRSNPRLLRAVRPDREVFANHPDRGCRRRNGASQLQRSKAAAAKLQTATAF
jgi:excinuclease ABC subunit A